MSMADFLMGRKDVEFQEGEGLNLAVHTIKGLEGRKFRFKGLRKIYSEIAADELLRLMQTEIDSMLILYRYSTLVKKYTDRSGCSHVDIRLIGRTSVMSKYNPLDIKLDIRTMRA